MNKTTLAVRKHCPWQLNMLYDIIVSVMYLIGTKIQKDKQVSSFFNNAYLVVVDGYMVIWET